MTHGTCVAASSSAQAAAAAARPSSVSTYPGNATFSRSRPGGSAVHKPTLRAVAYAQATRPDTLTAVTVNVDDKDTRALQAEWERRQIPVPLTVVGSPYREITRPIIDFVKNVRRASPRDVVTVFVPEYVVGKWWENV